MDWPLYFISMDIQKASGKWSDSSKKIELLVCHSRNEPNYLNRGVKKHTNKNLIKYHEYKMNEGNFCFMYVELMRILNCMFRSNLHSK